MSAPRFSTLQELVKNIRAQDHRAKALRKTKRALTEAQSNSAEQIAANRVAARIQEELKWQPRRLVMLTSHQHCLCGQSYRAVIGLLLETRHSVTGARRLRAPANLQEIDRLPHAKEEMNETIGICPHCMLERELVDALFKPVHDCCVQLSLFDHTPQRRIA